MDLPITVLLRAAADGDRVGLDELFRVLYPELRRVAHARLYAEGQASDMGTTALVHESFIKLMDEKQLLLEDRRQFFVQAAHVMRGVIVDELRALPQQPLHDASRPLSWGAEKDTGGEDALAVHEALGRLETLDPALAEVVEMRYFGGYTEAEIAELSGVTERTVRRRWIKARAALSLLLKGPLPDED